MSRHNSFMAWSRALAGGEAGNVLVVAGSEFLQVGVEPVGPGGAVFYQFTAV